ncbi:MAG TPA: HEAT repeat domain-containing protein [Verrucomicrobiae bacterium]|nr:HEAT repeat domain-containing protein [Verrucomicrobiae bacterium]
MEKTLQTICGMLQSPDGMRRCAAAMVIAELRPKQDAVVKALGASLKDANQLLTRYVLEAFEVLGTRAVVPYVLPLLDAPDVETKLRAAAIIARSGGDNVASLRSQFEKASPQQKRVLVDILARIHNREAMQLILDVLFDPDFELVKEACQAVRRHIGDAASKDRLALHRQVAKLMTSARVRKNDRVLTSCLLLIGYIGAPDARKILVKYSTPKNAGYIRRNALLGLKGLQHTGTAVNQVAGQMFKYLGESDYPNVVQIALDIIEKLLLGKGYEGQWRKLLRSKHSSVRAFAARRLAVTDNSASNRLMMGLLAHPDPQVSEIAAGALARHKGATQLLLGAFARERKLDAAWRLAKILKPHSESVDKKSLKKFAALAARALEAGDRRHEAILYLLRNSDPKLADDVYRQVGLKHKKMKKWGKAVECLRQIARSDSFDNELRYELSVCNLKQSARDLAPQLRAEDHALRGFQIVLQDKPFKLFDRLKREKTLAAPDLYYVGFHFSEGTGEELKFGRKLLEYVAHHWPKTKEGKAAKNKLKLAPSAPAAATPAPMPSTPATTT